MMLSNYYECGTITGDKRHLSSGSCYHHRKKVAVNFQNSLQHFFRVLNRIFGVMGLNNSPDVLCSLIYAHCLIIIIFSHTQQGPLRSICPCFVCELVNAD